MANVSLRDRTFRVATWNVHHDTPTKVLRPVLQDLIRRRVTLILCQEAWDERHVQMFKREGYFATQHREFVIAWDSDVWERVSPNEKLTLSEVVMYRQAGGASYKSRALGLWLRHKPSGVVVDVIDYHTPPAVQRGNTPNVREVPNRVLALKESMAFLRDRAKSHPNPCLYGGDDNVDENRQRNAWSFMLFRFTGLRQVPAPSPTHGHRRKGRRIDDFRVRGLKPGYARVLRGGGDHRIHMRDFVIKRRYLQHTKRPKP